MIINKYIHTYFIIILFISALTMIIGICIPFFGSLLGFLGGFAFAPTSYFVSKSIWKFFFVVFFIII